MCACANGILHEFFPNFFHRRDVLISRSSVPMYEVLVLSFAGNVRWLPKAAFLDLLLENPSLTSVTAPCIILSFLTFCLMLSATVYQVATAQWVAWTSAAIWASLFALTFCANSQQLRKTHAAALATLQGWEDALKSDGAGEAADAPRSIAESPRELPGAVSPRKR